MNTLNLNNFIHFKLFMPEIPKNKLYYFFLQGYKPKEIAQVLNIPPHLVEKAYEEFEDWQKKLRGYKK